MCIFYAPKSKQKRTCGPDGISNVFLRRYAKWLSHFLLVIFRSSISCGIVPSDWRVARVVPALKNGDPALLSNYRPISLTVTSCELLEHISNYMTDEFLDKRGILSPCQHGFRKGLSTTTQLLSTVKAFASVLDKAGQVDVIFLDFRKAFDRVSHFSLITKLSNYRFPPNIVNWICAYLSMRRQFVDVEGHYSECLPVNSRVPQGSVLGLLLSWYTLMT